MVHLEPKKLPTPSDFFACPIWRNEDGSDLFYPVLSPDDLPESERDLMIRAVFTTPGGKTFDGYVVGISRVFSIGLFGDDRFYHANQNLRAESEQYMREFIPTAVRQMFVHYGTCFPCVTALR